MQDQDSKMTTIDNPYFSPKLRALTKEMDALDDLITGNVEVVKALRTKCAIMRTMLSQALVKNSEDEELNKC